MTDAPGLTDSAFLRSLVQTTCDLTERERLLRTVGDNLPNAMIYQLVMEPDGRRAFAYISAGVETISGLSAEAVLREPGLLYEQIHEADRPDLARAEAESFARLTPFDLQVRKRHPSGEVRWSHLRSAPRRLADGRVVWDGVELDITPQKQAEAASAALQKRVQEAQRLESLGVLAGGIAHNVNNLLTIVLGHVYLAAQESPGPAVADHLARIEGVGLRAAGLCEQLLAYAGKSRTRTGPIELSRTVEAAEPLLRTLVEGRAALAFELAPCLPLIVGDAGQLHQVLQHLVTNAARAMEPHAGTIRLRTDYARLDGDFLREHAPDLALPSGVYVLLAVEDSGCGVTPEVRARMFEPFFTTDPASPGLGLAAVRGIVRGHDGFLRVESAPGEGCRVTAYLPAVAKDAE